MLSPLTGKEVAYECCRRTLGQEQWHRVYEADEATYFITESFLLRCSSHPLSIPTKLDVVARVALHNRAGFVPAVVTELEEMFVSYQDHAWAAPTQIYCPVYDPWE